ncbi:MULTISPECIES: bifunctional adenosylcobinamide kinase/adenosylcobinamide-phosphate guanylyltransferase [Bacillaceae]|uniref:bifunctional adenosylcobinamide kinase/adenosylcobinamide-phosphate guanylyltransferase n=1 Tax=Bacillales TaxID=1385 RepID=UPI001CCEAD92|nr:MULTISPECIES: bifunctional adenosylcobinamide kinase/adenosylcobinamide-phosphate guanylyltransferase [Bacillaceae]MCA0170398.1 bifunctional adenosylcobinamide kinase/adenosylcobinamide-phosphate guanylyltransferase [Bacillus sp. RAR_GA_16]
MHFVTGGAYNGKSKWVKNFYGLTEDHCWKSAYDQTKIPLNVSRFYGDVVVLEGVEQWLKGLTVESGLEECRAIWQSLLGIWRTWESERHERTVVIIGTDITKGIVPMEKEERDWRDLTGWAYQDLAAVADRVDVIWYGLNQQLK